MLEIGCDVRFAPVNSLPIVALASRPGCGNTWMRHLLELATGIYTGSVYNSPILFHNGFLGEKENMTNGRTVVVKTHKYDKTHINLFEKAVVLFRNPYSSFLAEFNREKANKTSSAPMESFIGEGWLQYVDVQILGYKQFANNWLESNMPILVIHYEDIKDNLLSEIDRITKFLNISSKYPRTDCILADINGKFKRPKEDKLHLKVLIQDNSMFGLLQMDIANSSITGTNTYGGSGFALW
uniref:WSC domain-containing protein 2-like n=1 Tax=Saccoglossus kowalevskii TaxID=10224 RepID=A0ABM0MC11_SACKO|nr:PREDICTED: WSC domain-containing protein 2-like [Saccoglossus kowalevskii]